MGQISIGVNNQTQSSLYEAEKILRKYIDIGKCYEWSLKNVLQNVIDRPCDVHKYIKQLYELYCDGYNFLDSIGLGYGLAITVPHQKYEVDKWYELNSKQQSELIGDLYPAIAYEAKKMIFWLESGKITITEHSGEYQGIKYVDNRTAEEKQACTLK
ncbi:hypothetical protein R6242_11750 [Iodobacter sp. CM08]|uniref:hypothetical protein n=1 Tax=Iodobacter sp. CM08 TaxID=3085902 RepID=UPI0029817A91|nr:hypothetical protein [Iodobacter sp. CM08]MDW5417240.1 hypothetical protein [Iodobacter sp. CM08]